MSVNKAWQGRRYKTKEYKEYEKIKNYVDELFEIASNNCVGLANDELFEIVEKYENK